MLNLILKCVINSCNTLYKLRLCLGTSISFQIVDFNYEIINEEFENDKVWVVILKFSTLTTQKTIAEFHPNPNLKNFDLPNNNKFEPIINFQMKSSFPNMALKNNNGRHSKLQDH